MSKILTYRGCVDLIDALAKLGSLQYAPGEGPNIFIYRSAGESSPEGWYAENIMSVASELVNDPEGQLFLLDEYERKTGKTFVQ